MRRLGRICALAIAVLVLGSCARPDDGRTTITLQRFFGACEAQYGGSTDVEAAEGECGIVTTLINRFEAENPDIDVRVNVVFWPGYDQLTAQLAANDEPDLVIMHASVIPDYQARDLIEPLGDDLRAAGVDPARFTQAAARGVTIDDQVWGMPFDTWAPLWHVNMNLFRQAGLVHDGQPILPRSPEELVAQAEQFKRATGKPYLVQITANEYAAYSRNFYTLMFQQGAAVFRDPDHIEVETEQARRVLNLFRTINERGLTTVNQDYSSATAGFINGDGGVMINGTWMVGAFDLEAKKPGRPLSDGYAVKTYPRLFPARSATFADSHVWVMPRDTDRTSKEKAASLRLLKFLADNDLQWARTGHLPAYQDIIDSPAFRALPHRADLAPLATNGTLLPPGVRRQFSIETILGEESASAIAGDKSVDQALTDAQGRVNTLLDNL